jgi:hypothetical protein
MKTILLIRDEARRPTHLSQNAVRARAPIGEIETVAACNCDRWGHPCSGCVERIAQPAPEFPISMPTKK